MDETELARQQAALTQALEMAARNAKPQTARSLTPREKRKRDPLIWATLLELAGLIAVMAPVFLFMDGLWDLAIWLLPWGLGGGAVLIASGWLLKRRAEASYVDPCLTVNAGERGIVVANPVQRHELPWETAQIALLGGEAGRRPAFRGIALASPLGAVTLDDTQFSRGRIVAVQIVGEAHKRGRFAELA